MPYDIAGEKNYPLEIDKIRPFIQKHGQFKFHFYNKWLNNWMRVFENAEKETQKQLLSPAFEKVRSAITEVFTQEIIWADYTFKLNFVIDGAKSYISSHKPPIHQKESSWFSGPEVAWSRTNIITHSEDPITITTFPMSGHTHIVIDGNHRLTDWINKGDKAVNYYFLSPEEIVNSRTLLFEIDKVVYGFVHEAYNFEKWTREKRYSDADLYHSSLTNTNFKTYK